MLQRPVQAALEILAEAILENVGSKMRHPLHVPEPHVERVRKQPASQPCLDGIASSQGNLNFA